MVLTLTLKPEAEAKLQEWARRQGLSPEDLALTILYDRLTPHPTLPEPRDDWERQLRALATDCGVSLSNEALSREQMYD